MYIFNTNIDMMKRRITFPTGNHHHFIVFLIFLHVFQYHRICGLDTHNVVKRLDTDFCLGRFDVQRDMIIRTEESRSMGAKFIDHADLNHRDDCLRLCCDTEDCDVFVFEEKLQGTCFLFRCGPAQNFRCKFTHHANYTSAVLTQTKRIEVPSPVPTFAIQPPQPPVGLSQHEIELTNLKDMPSRGDAPTTRIPPLGVRIGVPVTTTTKEPVINPTHCKRFQFQCHSGECIAVYNACDGIPQCMDGSDEGPECPISSTLKPAIVISSQKDTFVDSNYPQGDSGILQPQKQTISSQILQKPSYMIPAHNREDPMTSPQWTSRQNFNGEHYYDQDNRIFGHKGGIQVSNGNDGQPFNNMGYGMPAHDPYMQQSDGYALQSRWNQQDQRLAAQQQKQQQLAWPQQTMMHIDSQIPQYPNSQQSPDMWPVQQPKPAIISQANTHLDTAADLRDKHDDVATIKKEKPAEPKSGENEDDLDYEEEKTTEPPPVTKKKQRKHKNKDKKQRKHEDQIDKPVQEQLKIINSELDVELLDHDGAAKRPGGAVLSLTLGIIVTAALAVLVGCRATVVRRRARRGGKSSYAHDADFLVNGMYL